MNFDRNYARDLNEICRLFYAQFWFSWEFSHRKRVTRLQNFEQYCGILFLHLPWSKMSIWLNKLLQSDTPITISRTNVFNSTREFLLKIRADFSFKKLNFFVLSLSPSLYSLQNCECDNGNVTPVGEIKWIFVWIRFVIKMRTAYYSSGYKTNISYGKIGRQRLSK